MISRDKGSVCAADRQTPRTRLRRELSRLAVASVVVVLVSACGGGGSAKSRSGTTDATTNAAANGAVKAPSTLTIDIYGGVPTFDPNLISGAIAPGLVMSLIGDRLTTYGKGSADGKPALAQSLKVSDHGLIWTATLRHGAVFSDGTPITSADVEASFKRVLADRTSFWVPMISALDRISTPNASTVVFHLTHPLTAFPQIVSEMTFTIFPKSGLAQGENFFKKPIADGRYVVSSFDIANNRIVLTRNPRYWGPKPVVKRIVFAFVPDASTRLAQVRSGQANFAFYLPGTLLPQMTGNVHAQISPMPGNIELWMNDNSPLLRDVRIRKAISLALNRAQISQDVFGGVAKPVTSTAIFPSTDPFYRRATQTGPDISAAKAMLRGTKCASGCTLRLPYNTDLLFWPQPMATLEQQQLAAIGIHVETEDQSAAVNAATISAGKWDLMNSSPAMMLAIPAAWGSYIDPEDKTFMGNYIHYVSPRMHQLVSQLTAAPPSRQGPIAAAIDQQFANDVPYAPVVDHTAVSASNLPASVISLTYGQYVNIATEAGR